MPQPHVEHATPSVGAMSEFLPHGFCYQWNRPLLATHLVADVLIGVAYVAISFALAYLVHRARKDIPFSVVFVAFGLFIVTCGLTHFMEVWTLWQPVYWLSGGVKVVTAAASVATAVAMPLTVPKALATIRDARLSREREIAAARAAALEEQNAQLQEQAIELEQQREEAHALAEELEQTNQQLLAAIADAERARRVAEQAREAAEAANRVKAEFLAVMSHELRTPLNAIGGYAELLELGLRGPVTEAQRVDLGRIKSSQQHLLGLITGILNHARLEAGHVEYRADAVPLGALVGGVAALVAPQAEARGLTLAAEPCAPDVVARADEDRVRQIALNLLSNAIKYTPAGGSIRIACGVTAGGVYVRITDTGRGIPGDQQERIFEPFVQLDRSLSRPQEGTGLGLAISRELARAMGGDLTVESRPGEGSTFTLALPAA